MPTKSLCHYYYTFNPVATAEYVFAYRDMWDSEEKKKTPRRGTETRKPTPPSPLRVLRDLRGEHSALISERKGTR